MSNSKNHNLISSKEILVKTGISRATLNNYIKLGILPKPIVRKPEDGYQTIKSLGFFPREALDIIEEVKRLKKEGKPMGAIAEIIGGGEKKDLAKENLAEQLGSTIEKANGKKKNYEQGVYARELKLTLEGIPFPAYLLDFDFRIVWINRKAEERIIHQNVGSIEDIDSRNIFKLIFNWEFHCHVKNWKDFAAYHMSFVKIKFSKNWLTRLYKGISDKAANMLEKVYEETDVNKNNIIKGTYISFLKKDGSTDKYRAYYMFFKEGIFFVYVPFDY